MEKYITVKGFENYEVSNYGNVRNKKTNRILSAGKTKQGYLQV